MYHQNLLQIDDGEWDISMISNHCSEDLRQVERFDQKFRTNPFCIGSPILSSDLQASTPLLAEESNQLSESLVCYENIQSDHQTTSTSIVKREDEIKISKTPCNCAKTNCQKMYCECLAKGTLCSKACNCVDCHNLMPNPMLLKARRQISKKENTRTKFRTSRFKKGCTCKKSQCLNNYCDCRMNGNQCTEGCQCQDCLNKCDIQIRKMKIDQVREGQYEIKYQFELGTENSDLFKILNNQQ